jgi:hypothetical protein
MNAKKTEYSARAQNRTNLHEWSFTSILVFVLNSFKDSHTSVCIYVTVLIA